MIDYDTLIDAETWRFIRETERWYPTDAFEKDISEQRRVYDAMCRVFYHGRPDGVNAQDVDAAGVGVRIYQTDWACAGVTVLYCHGGSFSVGGLDSHDDICSEICYEAGIEVVSVDYRLLPENRREDALDDVQSAFEWVRKIRQHRVILVGDSAGGFLSASIAHANRGDVGIIAQVLIYPSLGDRHDSASMAVHANAPLLTRAEIVGLREHLVAGSEPEKSKFEIPLSDPDLLGLPPTVAISAECDPTADDAKDYAAMINRAGGVAIWIEDKGLVHGHLRARHSVGRARGSFDRVLRSIKLLANGEPLTRAKVVA